MTTKKQKVDEEMSDVSEMDYSVLSEQEIIEVEMDSKKGSDPLYKPPSRIQVKELNETAALFKSNLFKLQIHELLNHVKVQHKSTIETKLHLIKDTLVDMSPIDEQELTEYSTSLKYHEVFVPFPNPPPSSDSLLKFKFIAPTSIFVVGSFLLGTIIKKPMGFTIDLAVQIPDDVFVEKDFMNYRYFYKRACYLATLARGLKEGLSKKEKVQCDFEFINSDRRRPILILTFSKSIQIRIIPMISQDFFSYKKLAPIRNSVRPLIFVNEQDSTTNIDSITPTPRYNSAILADTSYVSHLNYLHHFSTTCPAFNDAACLLKVWVTQRSFDSGIPFPLNGFICSMILAYLLNGKAAGRFKASSSFTSYQLFRMVIDFLASFDTKSSCLFMTRDGIPLADEQFSAQSFKSVCDVVMVDPSGKLNLTALVSMHDFKFVQAQAQSTLDNLNDPKHDHFNEIFLQKMNISEINFDHPFKIKDPLVKPKVNELLDFTCVYDFLESHIPNILDRALSDKISSTETTSRIDLVLCHSSSNRTWSIDSSVPVIDDLKVFVNANNSSLKSVIIGPSPQDTEASTVFKHLWGNKVELRRFKDGSISNSVVFESGSSFEQRSLILPNMINYLLSIHTEYSIVSGPLDNMKMINKLLIHPETNISKGYKECIETFHLLTKILQDLELPLSVINVLACSDYLRYTSIHEPQADIDRFKPIEIIIQFEESRRWPDNLIAIQEMKLAFCVRICRLAQEKYPELITDIVQVNHNPIFNKCFLDVRVNGFFFRCNIFCEREESLLKVSEPNLVHAYNLKNSIIPTLTHQIRDICLDNAFLACSIRLVKRWIASHMLSPHVPDLAIELICIHVLFSPTTDPNSILRGFYKILNFLANWDWMNEPLVLLLNDDNQDVEQSIRDRFSMHRSRSAQGSKCMYIGTAIDPFSEIWDATPIIATRIVQLATSSLQAIQSPSYTIMNLFVTPITHYDALIQIKSLYAPVSLTQKKKPFKNLGRVPGYNPYMIKCYLEELERTFGNCALFFYDGCSGNQIGVVWKPIVHGEHKWKTNFTFSTKPLDVENKIVVANLQAMVEDMKILGTGLVEL